jgi:signal transduction histidine kinase
LVSDFNSTAAARRPGAGGRGRALDVSISIAFGMRQASRDRGRRAMGRAPDFVVGLTALQSLWSAPMPADDRPRTFAGVDQLTPNNGKRLAEGGSELVLDRAGRIGAAALVVARRWVASGTWRATANLVLWLVMSYFVAVIAVAGLLVTVMTVPSIRLGVAARGSALRLLAGLVRLDRRRIERFSEVDLQPLALPRIDSSASSLTQAWATARSLWQLPAYELVCVPIVTALALAAVAWWWVTIACFVVVTHGADETPQYPFPQPVDVLGVHLGQWSLTPIEKAGPLVVGVALVLFWPTALRVVSAVDGALARRLLGPSPTELSREVVRLSESRAQAVAAADAERRRIERDLHDGFQPQLVSLALNLGLARSRLASDPDSVRALLDRAHDDAKRAAEDLRNLVRGIHPSVLDERGLDAAFSALAADCRVPLQIEVRLVRRPPREAEVIAYFVVAEAITNLNKHAHARAAMITVAEFDGSLRVLVQDDGQGGARAEPGGGLAGLATRIAGVDGTFSLTSPEGGPTRIEARIPCEW